MDETVLSKQCHKCGLVKPLSEMGKVRSGKIGPVCKLCRSQSLQQYREQHPEKVKAWNDSSRNKRNATRQLQKRFERPGYKFCSSCGLEFPSTSEYFRRDIRLLSGIASICRACHNAQSHQRYQQNPEVGKRINELYKARRKANPEKYRESSNKRMKEWRQQNPEKVKAINYSQYQKAADKNRENAIAYAKAHTDERRITENRRRARQQNLPNSFTPRQWQQSQSYFNNSCAYCGVSFSMISSPLASAAHADHYIPLKSEACPGTVVNNMVPACAACNLSKHNYDPLKWVVFKFGEQKAKQIITRIEAYFASIVEKD